jgi:hypothetical protein
MAKWLQRQEAIDLHTVYLQWCDKQRPYDEEVKCGDEDNLELDIPESADADGDHDMLEADHVTVTSDHSLYHIAKKPAFSSVPLHRLKQTYGASQFLTTLKLFLQENLPGHTLKPNEYDCYNVYNIVHITLSLKPHVSDHKCHKTIHETLEHSNGPQK